MWMRSLLKSGESPVIVTNLGILITGPNTLSVEVLPLKLMNTVEIDLSVLVELGDGIFVRDLELGDDITILNDPDEMLARVVQPAAARAELLDEMEAEEGAEGEEIVEEGETYSAEVEVISKGREEEE